MTDQDSRIAVLESEHRHHKETIGDVVEQLRTINNSVVDINSKLDKNMGFLAGAAFVFSLIGAFLGMGGAALLRKIGIE